MNERVTCTGCNGSGYVAKDAGVGPLTKSALVLCRSCVGGGVVRQRYPIANDETLAQRPAKISA